MRMMIRMLRDGFVLLLALNATIVVLGTTTVLLAFLLGRDGPLVTATIAAAGSCLASMGINQLVGTIRRWRTLRSMLRGTD